MSVVATIHPIRMFYWVVKFDDGYRLEQFNSEGEETLIKDFVPPQCWGEKEGKPFLLKTSNIFQAVEKLHGRATKVGWHAFDEARAKNAMKLQPGANIQVPINGVPHVHVIPNDCFAYIAMEIQNEWHRVREGKPEPPIGYQSDLYFGYLNRDMSGNGKVDHMIINPKEEE